MSDISLSGSAVVAITAILGAMATAIGFLFRAYDGSQKAQIKREQELTNKLLPAVENNTRTLERLVEVFQASQKTLERLVEMLQVEQSKPNPRRGG